MIIYDAMVCGTIVRNGFKFPLNFFVLVAARWYRIIFERSTNWSCLTFNHRLSTFKMVLFSLKLMEIHRWIHGSGMVITFYLSTAIRFNTSFIGEKRVIGRTGACFFTSVPLCLVAEIKDNNKMGKSRLSFKERCRKRHFIAWKFVGCLFGSINYWAYLDKLQIFTMYFMEVALQYAVNQLFLVRLEIC